MEEKDNATSQGEQTPGVENHNPQSMADKLRSLGIDPNELIQTLIIPVVDQLEEMRSKALNEKLARVVEDAASKASQRASEEFMAKLNQQINSPPSQESPSPAGGIPAQETIQMPRAGGSGAMETLLPVLVKMFTGGNGTAPADGGLAQMAQTAKNYAEFTRTVMQPIIEMQATMRQSVLSEMTTYSKTGGTLPWERDTVESAPEPKTTASLNQADKDKTVKNIASRIKFV